MTDAKENNEGGHCQEHEDNKEDGEAECDGLLRGVFNDAFVARLVGDGLLVVVVPEGVDPEPAEPQVTNKERVDRHIVVGVSARGRITRRVQVVGNGYDCKCVHKEPDQVKEPLAGWMPPAAALEAILVEGTGTIDLWPEVDDGNNGRQESEELEGTIHLGGRDHGIGGDGVHHVSSSRGVISRNVFREAFRRDIICSTLQHFFLFSPPVFFSGVAR